ncbi:MAG: hypothetical protein ACE5EK_10090, partial [Nitrospinales bacterium]
MSGKENAVESKKVGSFFNSAWRHLKADRNGLSKAPSKTDNCHFLVFEDFGTSGLLGEVDQPYPYPDKKNNFYYFFRAVGLSDKGEKGRGRWGIGKHVFPRSSNISSLFGFTIRADDNKRFLMGRSNLKIHAVGGKYYKADGCFGLQAKGGMILPVDDSTYIEEFSKTFNLKRNGEPGFSVVVPWYDLEITHDEIIRAVIRDYFYPILAGKLEVVVNTPTVNETIDRRTLINIAEKTGELDKLRPTLELAVWALGITPDDIKSLKTPSPDKSPKWSEYLIPDELLDSMRTAFEKGERLAIKVPVTITENDLPERESFFYLFLTRDLGGDYDGRPVFIRDGIIISNNRAPLARGIRSLVVADDSLIAAFLGNAENPAHTEWQHNCSNFKDKYKFGKSWLGFITKSVYEIVRIISKDDKKEDRTLLASIFKLPFIPDEESVRSSNKEPGKKDGPEPPPPPPPPPPKPQRFKIQQVNSGFTITPGKEGSIVPPYLDIRVAYNTRKSNPFKKYYKADFELDKEPIQVEPENIEIVSCRQNHLIVAVKDPDFRLVVRGFDERRD